MIRLRKKAQSTVEYALLIVIVIGVFLGAGNYAKRGIQGRWKEAVDGLGDQYDPRFSNGNIQQTISSNTSSTLVIVNLGNGFYTLRTDTSSIEEHKKGFLGVAGY